MLVKPSAPKKTIVVEAKNSNDAIREINFDREAVDKYSEDFFDYQHELKNHIDNKTMYNDDLQRCFIIIMGQYSPDIEQLLKAEKIFATIKQ